MLDIIDTLILEIFSSETSLAYDPNLIFSSFPVEGDFFSS
jgi:hypothetical protein